MARTPVLTRREAVLLSATAGIAAVTPSTLLASDSIKTGVHQETPPPATPPPQRQPPAQSPQLLADGKVTFRLLAPHASSVELAGDIYQGLPRTGTTLAPASSIPMTKGSDGLWTGTSAAAFLPGAWRYHFRVDGMDVPDPRNVLSSPYQHGTESLLVIPGDFSETRSVPHGAVARVNYNAFTFAGAAREMYIYTPPGYEKGAAAYPVFYLIHGGGETDSSWSTVGRAGDILDNLIAAGKAQPMIIVMPAGWTPSGPQVMTADATKDPFNNELIQDIIPLSTRTTAPSPTPNIAPSAAYPWVEFRPSTSACITSAPSAHLS